MYRYRYTDTKQELCRPLFTPCDHNIVGVEGALAPK